MTDYLKRIAKLRQGVNAKIFCVIAGKRLSGKTTLAGTLPGTTVLLHPITREAGADSALAMAKDKKNQLVIANFDDLYKDENGSLSLTTHLNYLSLDNEVENIYMDGISSVSNMVYDLPEVQELVANKDGFASYRMIGDKTNEFVHILKKLTLPSFTAHPKNVYMTMALTQKTDALGNITDVKFDVKGNMAITEITQQCPNVAVAMMETKKDDNGQEIKRRVLLTRTQDHWPGRIGGLLDKNNPGIVEADLSVLNDLIKSAVL